MNLSTVRIWAFTSAVPLLLTACSLDPDGKLNRAVERYLESKPRSLQELEAEFIKNVSSYSFRKKYLHTNGRFLFAADEYGIEIMHPLSLALSMPEGERIRYFDVSDDYAVISDGIRISIFDGDGDHIVDETAGDNKSPVRSVLSSGGSILYYRNFCLYRHAVALNSTEQFLKETFPPPYAQYYTVSMYVRDSYLCILTGIAGSYNFSIVNLPEEKIILKNLAMSSSKYAMSGDSVFYIKGSSGNWQLIKYGIAAKSKQTIGTFTSIIDIELTEDGYMVENNRGLWVSEYGGGKKRLPFAYQLAGTCRGMLLVRYGNSYYLINTKRLFDVIRNIEVKAPEIFKPGDDRAAQAVSAPER